MIVDNNNNFSGFVPIVPLIGMATLLVIGIIIGNFVTVPGLKNQKVVDLPVPTKAEALPVVETTPVETVSVEAVGKISGYLIYPSDHIPPQVGVCAELISNTTIKTCVNQIVDPKYSPTGVGYEMSLPPGQYYVYSVLGDWRAYYNEFVTCGLKASCPSHTKIPVVVTAGSNNDQIFPHDWYDTTSPTVAVSPVISSLPTLSKINPDALKLMPTSTPTPTIKVIPTLKKINFGF